MDEKNYGARAPMRVASRRFVSSSFLRNKHLTRYVVLSILIIFALTLSAAALITADPASTDSEGELPLPSVAVKDLEPETEQLSSGAIVPSTTVWYHGIKLGTYSRGQAKVADVLESFNVVLGENDVMNCALTDDIWWGMEITVDEVTYSVTELVETIPYKTVETPLQTIAKGTRQTVVEGVEGERRKTLTEKFVNGESAGVEVTEEMLVSAPVTEEVNVGVGGVFTAPDGTEYPYSYYIDVTATAYTHTGDPTYTGAVAEVGVIAVDPRYIPLKSRVYVIGGYGDYGVCRAEDIGGGIKRYRIDVFLDTEEECVQFGRRSMRCYVLE